MAPLASLRIVVLGVQMLFVAFGALVLVPLLTGLDPCIALFTAGIGTLTFQLITGGTVPIFLASSFAFIDPIRQGIGHFGVGATLGGLMAAGLVYGLFSLAIRLGGPGAVQRFVPPIVAGPVIMVIGLKLAPVAVGMARSFDGSASLDGWAVALAMVSLATAVAVAIYARGTLRLVPVMSGIVVGYVVAWVGGAVDFRTVLEAPWIGNPWARALAAGSFAVPAFDIHAILFIAPVALAPAIEHVGDILAISSVAGRDFVKSPGLHRTLLGDGVATSLASALGGPPNTTYSEVTGAVALTGATDPRYMRIAAVAAIVLAFAGKLGAVLRTIPGPVMGGILMLLFGMIGAIGVRSLVEARVDMTKPRNLVIASLILTIGIGDMAVCCGRFSLSGIGLAGLTGVVLNVLLPREAAE